MCEIVLSISQFHVRLFLLLLYEMCELMMNNDGPTSTEQKENKNLSKRKRRITGEGHAIEEKWAVCVQLFGKEKYSLWTRYTHVSHWT